MRSTSGFRAGAAALLATATIWITGTACHARPAATPLAPPDRQAIEVREHPGLPEVPVVSAASDPLSPAVCADDPRIAACKVHRPDASPHLLGLATRGGTIGVAWVTAGNSWLQGSRDPNRPGRAGFAWFDAALNPRGETRLDVSGSAFDIDLAATADGWVVAVQTDQSLELLRLAPDGAPAGPRTALARAWTPGITTTPAGDVLVVHTATLDGRAPEVATLVDRRGAVVWSTEVFEGSIEPNFGGQVYTDGGGFLVGRRDNHGVSVARVEPDGTVSARRTVAGSTEYPSLAWCGADGRLVWTDFGALKIRGTAIDRAGRAQGVEHVLGGTPTYFNHSPALCDGPGALVLLGGYTGGTGVSNRLDLTHVDPVRGPQPGAVAVLADNGHNAYDSRLVRLDDRRVAVGWISLSRAHTRSQIGLAVVEPPSRLAQEPLRAVDR